MTVNDINGLGYSEFVGLIDERNRPSGGIKTIQTAILNSRLSKDSKVLEIGSNTGFTSVNINLLSGAHSTGIDVNLPSIKIARQYAKDMGAVNVEFAEVNATKLPFPDNSFDMVWCSNVTSFIEDKKQAIHEYLRVLKPSGTLVAVPIYYRNTPPEEIIKDVSEAINSKIQVWNKDYWISLFQKSATEQGLALEIYFEKDFIYLDQSDKLDNYIDMLMSKSLIAKTLSKEEKTALIARARHFYTLFNKNNFMYAGYSIFLMQKRQIQDEIELFISKEI